MGEVVISWRTVAIVLAVLATTLALVIAGHVELATVVGAMGTLLGGLLRQLVYRKPEPPPNQPTSRDVTEVDATLREYLRRRTTQPPPPDDAA